MLVPRFTYSWLTFRARTSSISYKYGLYFTDTALVCANSTRPVVVQQTEKLSILATPPDYSTAVPLLELSNTVVSLEQNE